MAGPIPGASGRIFISYRREETAYPAGWLYDRLTDHFRGGQVFKDVDSIQLGDDFVEVITRAVGSCDVLLALIGDQWLRITDEHGRRRLDNPDDFVRLEIEAALTRKVRVIPILVDGARMPRADELPESLAKLVRRQALELSPSRFEFDTSRLLKVLDWTLAQVRTQQDDAASKLTPAGEASGPSMTEVEEAPAPSEPAEQRRMPAIPPEQPRRRPSTRALILAGTGVGVVVILLIVAFVANSRTTPPPDETAVGQGTAQAGGGIKVDPTPVTSADEIRLTGLNAVGPNDPPLVGDTIAVSYSLTNVGDQPIRLELTFVGARDAADANRDSEETNEGRVLSTGETVDVEARVQLTSAGEWRLWPCYELSGGRSCPDEWRAFSVLAR